MAILGIGTKTSLLNWQETILSNAFSSPFLVTKTYILNEFFVAWDNLENEQFRDTFGWFFNVHGYHLFLAHSIVQEHLIINKKTASQKYVVKALEKTFSALCEALEIESTERYIDLNDMFEEAGLAIVYKGLWDER